MGRVARRQIPLVAALLLGLTAPGCARPEARGHGPTAARAPAPSTAPGEALLRAVRHPGRPTEDRARDALRKPARVLAFFGIAQGMSVAELMTGRGYYAEILARAVGPQGKVWAHNTPFVQQRFAAEPLAARLARLQLPQLVPLVSELEQPGLPRGRLDAVLLILFYHDTYWQDVDRGRMNRAVYAALKPGGVFGIVDHHAATGRGAQQVKSLHRVEDRLVIREVLAAGFQLEARSDLLRHPEDRRTANVFAPHIRGKTDRFVLRFRKPARH